MPQPETTVVHEGLQTSWERAAQSLHVIASIDVLRAFCKHCSHCRLLVIQRASPREWMLLQVRADPCDCSLMRKNIRHIGRLVRRILGRERSEAVIAQGRGVLSTDVSSGALIKARATARCNNSWQRLADADHLTQYGWKPVNKLSHSSSCLLPIWPHDFDVYSSATQDDEPPQLEIAKLLLLPAIWRRSPIA